MTRLFHVSEESAIKSFHPRPVPKNSGSSLSGYAVWAVDEAHLANYLLPRDCPRVAYSVSSQTSEEDKRKFFPSGIKKHVVAVEEKWLDRIQNTVLYLYELSPKNFECIDKGAGYFVSRKKETPMQIIRLNDLVNEMQTRNIDLKPFPSLWDLQESVAASTLEFSCIRMRNAQKP